MKISFNKSLKKIFRKITGFIFARYFFAKLFIGFVASTIVLSTFLYGAFEKFELVTLDQRFRLRSERPTDENIVFIEMAEDSIEAIGRWPWPRQWHATLISILDRYNTRFIIFDVIFDKESGRSHDLVFGQAIRSAGNVYLPFVFQFKEGDLPVKGELADGVRNVIFPLKGFLDASYGYGHVNVAPDADGTLRRSPLVLEYKGKAYPQIAFKTACDYLGVKDKDIIVNSGRNITLKDSRIGEIKIPIDNHNQMLVSWAGRWKDTFKHYSYIDIIVSYNQILKGEKPRIDLNELKDKICIIGLTASGLYDIRPTPLEPSYPIVGMNGNIINNIIKKDFITKVPGWLDIFLIYLMGLLISLLVSKVRFIRGAVYMFFTVLGYILISFAIFATRGKWFVVVYPALSMFASFLGVTLYNEVILALEKKRYFNLSIRDGLTKLFNIRHFKEILQKEFIISSGKRRARKLSLIMADVDYFKNFNDTYGHQVGDFVLKRVAKMFKDGSRGHDVVARYGGEEFIMMLPGTDIEDAKTIAERIREAIEKTPLRRSNETYSVTVSLGAATLEDERTKEELIKKVDTALYMAKKAGRNRVCVK